MDASSDSISSSRKKEASSDSDAFFVFLRLNEGPDSVLNRGFERDAGAEEEERDPPWRRLCMIEKGEKERERERARRTQPRTRHGPRNRETLSSAS